MERTTFLRFIYLCSDYGYRCRKHKQVINSEVTKNCYSKWKYSTPYSVLLLATNFLHYYFNVVHSIIKTHRGSLLQ